MRMRRRKVAEEVVKETAAVERATAAVEREEADQEVVAERAKSRVFASQNNP
jgi:hypothetical protein